jgi:hypothetical protein
VVAKAKGAGMKSVTMIAVDSIVADESTQWRHDHDGEAITEMTDHLNEGGTLPPIDVFDDGESRRVADGHHRLAAYRRSGKKMIPACMHKGDANAAFMFGLKAGVANNFVRARPDDLKRAALEILRRGIETSNVAIAKLLHRDEKTVRRWRKEAETTSALPKSPARTGIDGRTINVGKIGQPKSARRAPEPRPAGVQDSSSQASIDDEEQWQTVAVRVGRWDEDFRILDLDAALTITLRECPKANMPEMIAFLESWVRQFKEAQDVRRIA